MADDNKINPLASEDGDGTLIKSFPLAEAVNDDDDLIIETQLPQTEHIHADKLREYMMSVVTDTIYPVGSIYMSVENTSPATLFGGTWTQIKDTFLLASGPSYNVNAVGGSATATLSTSNLPSHTHSLPSHTHSLPSHTHSFSATTGSTTISGSIFNVAVQSSSSGIGCSGVFSTRYSSGDVVGYPSNSKSASSSYTDGVTMSAPHTHSVSGTTGSTSGTSGSTSGTSGSTGTGSSFSIMPPYTVVNVWKRTA